MWHALVSTDTIISILIVVAAAGLCVAAIIHGGLTPLDDPYYWDDEDENE